MENKKKSNAKKHSRLIKKAIKKHHIAGEKKLRREQKIEEKIHPGLHQEVRKIEKKKRRTK